MEAWLSAVSTDGQTWIDELRSWLAEEPEIRGRLRSAGPAVRPGQMGVLAEVLVAGVGSSGALTVLASSLSVWLKHRHSDMRVIVHSPDGTSVELDARRCDAAEVEAVLRASLRPEVTRGDDSG